MPAAQLRDAMPPGSPPSQSPMGSQRLGAARRRFADFFGSYGFGRFGFGRSLLAWLAVVALAACTEMPKPAAPSSAQGAVAIFAGGCFWCVEQDFEKLDGVITAESGYTGGRTANPTYYQVAYGLTGHVEAVRVIYDPARVSYAQLLDYYWRHVDPTSKNGQFCDRGPEYRSVIFWRTEEERLAAEASRDGFLKSGQLPVVHTEILPASTFWMAETEHQDYYLKNPIRYNYYRAACGRDARVKAVWGAVWGESPAAAGNDVRR